MSSPNSLRDSLFSLDGPLTENPIFTAGFGLMGAGVALAAVRQGLVASTSLIRRRMLVSLEIPNKDKSYEWVLAWLANQNTLQRRTLFKSHNLSVETALKQEHVPAAGSTFNIVAGTGTHYFRYRGAWMQMQRERETKAMHLMTHTPWETITITALSKDRGLFIDLLTEARELSSRQKEGKLTIHTAWGTEWRPFGKPRRKRPLDSVVLADGVSERLSVDLKSFLGRRQWYTQRGVPYRRGYLLHGPPGSGKSSYIQALAAEHNYDVCILNLSERGLSDDKLNHLLSNIPERSFVLIEDVDAAFNKRVQTSEDGYQSSITFSGFLNALDGVASGEERIVFMTTNHLERLDPALIRPGRVDMMELLDDATPKQARALYEKFYGEQALGSEPGTELDAAQLATYAEHVEKTVQRHLEQGQRISMAALQGHFIRHVAEDGARQCSSLYPS